MPLQDKIQNLINSLDQGVGQWLLRGILFAGLTLAVLSSYAFAQYRGLKDPEAMECAQLARALADGEGFVTRCIRPIDFWHLARQGRSADLSRGMPDLRHAPLFPAVLSLGFRALGSRGHTEATAAPTDMEMRIIVPLGIMVSACAGLVVFLLGRRLFDVRVGLTAAAAYLLTDAVLADAISGTAVPLMALTATAAAYAAVATAKRRLEGRGAVAWAATLVSSAVLSGLAFLAGYSLLVLGPCLALFLGRTSAQRRWPVVLAFLAILGMAVAPWLVRNRNVGGEILGTAPYAVLAETPAHPEDAFQRTLSPALDRTALPAEMRAKFVDRFAGIYDVDLRTLGSGLIVALFLLSFFHRFDRDEQNSLRWFVGLAMLLVALTAGFGAGPSDRLLRVFLPLAAVYGAAFFFVVTDRLTGYDPASQNVLAWLLVLLTALPAALRIWGGSAAPYPPYYPPYIAYVSQLLEPEEAVCTDIPWATAWYGRRVSILLPQRADDLYALRERCPRLSAVYLTTETGDKPLTRALVSGREHSWLPLLERKVPPDFPWPHGFDLPPGTRDQLFLTDRVRWTEEKPSGLADSEKDGFEITPAP